MSLESNPVDELLFGWPPTLKPEKFRIVLESNPEEELLFDGFQRSSQKKIEFDGLNAQARII